MPRYILTTIFALLLPYLGALPFVTSAEQLGASLYIAPLAENPRVGSNFSVAIKVDSLAQPINAVKGTLTFHKDKLEIISISKIGSILNLWVEEPNFSNTEGVLKFQGGVPRPGFMGNGGIVMYVIFKAKHPGVTSLVWKNGEVLANDGHGSNILINLQNLDFSIERAAALGEEGTQNPLLIFNFLLLSIVAGVGLFFLYKWLIAQHDKHYHHGADARGSPEEVENIEHIVHQALEKELEHQNEKNEQHEI